MGFIIHDLLNVWIRHSSIGTFYHCLCSEMSCKNQGQSAGSGMDKIFIDKMTSRVHKSEVNGRKNKEITNRMCIIEQLVPFAVRSNTS